MRHLLYGLAVAAMAGAAVGLALLPRLTAHWLWFGLVGALLSAAGGGGWVLAGATAGEWPRPRAGWMLIMGGTLGSLVSLLDWQPLPLLWALAQAVSGALLIVRVVPRGRRGSLPSKPGPVQAPVSRRQAER
ncbi:MAG: hypothetical protein ACOY93_05745 [Bacillota bacterium]